MRWPSLHTGRHSVWLPLLLLTILSAAPLPAQAPLRVVSFNIRYGTARDGDHAWPNRRALVAGTIRDHAPHLLGVQEALHFQLEELAATVPGHRRLGVGRDDGRAAGEYAALLVDTARLSVLDHGTFWLSDTPDVPGSTHWGNTITRICTWARLADRVTGDTMRVYNVHFDHESQPSRERAAALVQARLQRDGSPRDLLLLLGDFNADEANPAVRRLLDQPSPRLRDTFRALHPRAEVVGTFNAFRGDSTGGKIDAVFAGDRWEVLAAGIDRRRIGALWPSDHFPVWAHLRFAPEFR